MIPCPDTFLHLVATCWAGLAAFFLIVSVLSDERPHCLHLAGLCLIFGLATFSDSAWTYAISLFLTATVITELGFIERLAAIIFRNKHYFSPPRSPAPRLVAEDQGGQGADGESVQQSPRPSRTPDTGSPPSPRAENGGVTVRDAQAAPQDPVSGVEFRTAPKDVLVRQLGGLSRVYEILSIDKLSRTTGRTFEGNVQIKLRSGPVEFDAFSEGKDGMPDLVVEVKALTMPDQEALLSSAHRKLMDMRAYREETKRTTVGIIILVVQSPKDVSAETQQRLQNLVAAQPFTVQLQIYRAAELFVR